MCCCPCKYCSCKYLIILAVLLALVAILAGIIGAAVKQEFDRTYAKTIESLKEAIPDYVTTTFKFDPSTTPPVLPHWKRTVEDYILYWTSEKEE